MKIKTSELKDAALDWAVAKWTCQTSYQPPLDKSPTLDK